MNNIFILLSYKYNNKMSVCETCNGKTAPCTFFGGVSICTNKDCPKFMIAIKNNGSAKCASTFSLNQHYCLTCTRNFYVDVGVGTITNLTCPFGCKKDEEITEQKTKSYDDKFNALFARVKKLEKNR